MSHEQTTLGRPTGPSDSRDAVHVAVFPAFSDTALSPGAWVRKGERHGSAWKVCSAHAGDGIGVVDVFLPGPVPPGTGFFVMLRPGTITGLKHLWTHPDFAPTTPTGSAQ